MAKKRFPQTTFYCQSPAPTAAEVQSGTAAERRIHAAANPHHSTSCRINPAFLPKRCDRIFAVPIAAGGDYDVEMDGGPVKAGDMTHVTSRLYHRKRKLASMLKIRLQNSNPG
jgi:hypothetical protein